MFDDDAEEDEVDVGVCAAEALEEEAEKGDVGEVPEVLRPLSAVAAGAVVVVVVPLRCAVVEMDMPESPVRTLRGIAEKPSW